MTARIKLKELESHLEGVEVFDRPKVLLEQYPTPPHIAACLLHTMQSSFGDVEDKLVADLGEKFDILISFTLAKVLAMEFANDHGDP